jgi:hypothetical protein
MKQSNVYVKSVRFTVHSKELRAPVMQLTPTHRKRQPITEFLTLINILGGKVNERTDTLQDSKTAACIFV